MYGREAPGVIVAGHLNNLTVSGQALFLWTLKKSPRLQAGVGIQTGVSLFSFLCGRCSL
jgi:hypothetical protein